MSEDCHSKHNGVDNRSSLDSKDSGSDTKPTQHSSIWASVDRTGFPEKCDKAQPWKDNDLAPTQEYRPWRWNLIGRAWDRVMVAVDEIIDLGTGKTW